MKKFCLFFLAIASMLNAKTHLYFQGEAEESPPENIVSLYTFDRIEDLEILPVEPSVLFLNSTEFYDKESLLELLREQYPHFYFLEDGQFMASKYSVDPEKILSLQTLLECELSLQFYEDGTIFITQEQISPHHSGILTTIFGPTDIIVTEVDRILALWNHYVLCVNNDAFGFSNLICANNELTGTVVYEKDEEGNQSASATGSIGHEDEKWKAKLEGEVTLNLDFATF